MIMIVMYLMYVCMILPSHLGTHENTKTNPQVCSDALDLFFVINIIDTVSSSTNEHFKTQEFDRSNFFNTDV